MPRVIDSGRVVVRIGSVEGWGREDGGYAFSDRVVGRLEGANDGGWRVRMAGRKIKVGGV